MKTDILIVGSGCSGLYCALQCPKDKNILLISKSDLESSDSYLAQGGICMLKDDTDYESYFEDTMKAGHYENDKESVGIMIRSSQDVIHDLVSYGVEFEQDPEGQFLFTKEGAHSDKRILFHDDVTGQELTSKRRARGRELPNVTLREFTTMVDIVEKDNVCYGAVVTLSDGTLDVVDADYVVLACGGIGGLYEHSTNYSHLTGDALAIALRHNVALKNTNYVQIHPTTFYTEKHE
ncbi:MAG: FAD-binding protein, partial [Acutalibacteraceae bacterium]|nr:FAD-binding protein [Acutalibacteraceae bacterium]